MIVTGSEDGNLIVHGDAFTATHLSFYFLLEEVMRALRHGRGTAGFLTDRLGNLTLIRGSVGTMASKLM